MCACRCDCSLTCSKSWVEEPQSCFVSQPFKHIAQNTPNICHESCKSLMNRHLRQKTIWVVYPDLPDLVMWIWFGAAMGFKTQLYRGDFVIFATFWLLLLIGYYTSIILPLLLIHSWALAIDPFLTCCVTCSKSWVHEPPIMHANIKAINKQSI